MVLALSSQKTHIGALSWLIYILWDLVVFDIGQSIIVYNLILDDILRRIHVLLSNHLGLMVNILEKIRRGPLGLVNILDWWVPFIEVLLGLS